jgi:circadian clock protein KaiB
MPRENLPSEEVTVNKKAGDRSLKLDGKYRGKYVLKLYVSGMTLRSTMAVDNIQRICRDYLPGRCKLEIIDIYKQLGKAKEAQIIVTPTLIKESPLPLHRLVGNLSETAKVLKGLDIIAAV